MLKQTHRKLLKEIEYGVQLELELSELKEQHQKVMKENVEIGRELEKVVGGQQRHVNEKVRQVETALVESQKKNDLLRIDLESMRSKVLEVMAAKEAAEEERVEADRNTERMDQKIAQRCRDVGL